MRYSTLAVIALAALTACSTGLNSTRELESYSDVRTYSDHVQHMHYADIDGGKVAYIDEGEGEVVVLMHGIPTSSWMYRKVIGLLVSDGYRVIAPDLMGMGASERKSDSDALSVKRQSGYMLELLGDHLDLRDWTHVVHDFGGPISWEMMEDPRFRASRLVILDTFAFERGWHPDLNAMTKAAVKFLTADLFDAAFFSVAVKGMVHNAIFADDFMLNGYCEPLEAGASFTFKCLYFESNALKAELPRYQETLAAFDGEVLGIVWGEHDEFLAADEQVEQLQTLLKLPDSQVVVLGGVGHLVPEEDPFAVFQMVTAERGHCAVEPSLVSDSEALNPDRQGSY